MRDYLSTSKGQRRLCDYISRATQLVRTLTDEIVSLYKFTSHEWWTLIVRLRLSETNGACTLCDQARNDSVRCLCAVHGTEASGVKCLIFLFLWQYVKCPILDVKSIYIVFVILHNLYYSLWLFSFTSWTFRAVMLLLTAVTFFFKFKTVTDSLLCDFQQHIAARPHCCQLAKAVQNSFPLLECVGLHFILQPYWFRKRDFFWTFYTRGEALAFPQYCMIWHSLLLTFADFLGKQLGQ